MKKELQTIFLIFAVFLVPLEMRAATADELAAQISSFTGGGTGSLTAVASGNTVTVTGTLTDVTQTLDLNIDAGVTVDWNATISTGAGFDVSQWQLILVSGSFNMLGGSISVGDGVEAAINAWNDNSAITVSGGNVSATTGRAINISNNSSLIVSGGTVSAYFNATIMVGDGSTVSVSGGTVTTIGGTAINVSGATSQVMVSGTGIVS